MSDGRKKLSGFAYRKRNLEKNKKVNEVLSKTSKLDVYFQKKDGIGTSTMPVNECIVSEERGNLLYCC